MCLAVDEHDNISLEPDCNCEMVCNLLIEELPSYVKIPSHSWFYKRVGQLFLSVKTRCSFTYKCNTCSILFLQGKKDKLKIYQGKAKKIEQLKNNIASEDCITFDLELSSFLQ